MITFTVCYCLVRLEKKVKNEKYFVQASLMVLMNSAKPYNETQDYPLDLLDHDIIRAWSYIIILSMLLFPEVLTMTYSFYRIVMKPESRVDISTLLLVSLL